MKIGASASFRVFGDLLDNLLGGPRSPSACLGDVRLGHFRRFLGVPGRAGTSLERSRVGSARLSLPSDGQRALQDVPGAPQGVV